MNRIRLHIIGFCGILLMFAAFPVLAQDKPVVETSINKRLLADFAYDVYKKWNAKEVDLNAPFSLEFEGFITNTGKLDLERSKIVRSEGDPKLVDIVKNGIEAIGESGYFQYLQQLGVEKATIVASQDSQNFSISMLSDSKTKERASTIASGLNAAVKMGKMQTKNDDEKLLLDNTTVTSGDSAFKISLAIPSARFQEMILRNIAKSAND